VPQVSHSVTFTPNTTTDKLIPTKGLIRDKNCAQEKDLISATLTTYYFSSSLNFSQKRRLGTTFVPTTGDGLE
jgi:hypothetical protein